MYFPTQTEDVVRCDPLDGKWLFETVSSRSACITSLLDQRSVNYQYLLQPSTRLYLSSRAFLAYDIRLYIALPTAFPIGGLTLNARL